MAQQQSDDALLVEVGLTEREYLAALKRIEAQTVRASKKNEETFKRSNRSVVDGFNRADKAAQGFASGGMRNVGLQLSQVAQQGAATGDYMRALSIQMPDLLLGFGGLGIAIGAASAVLAPFIMNLFGASDATEKLVNSLVGGQTSLDGVRGTISQLRDLQNQYTRAIEASATASGSAASIVAANSKKEFEARKQVLQVELELLRIRGAEQQSQLTDLQDAQNDAVQDELNRNTNNANGGNILDPSLRPYVYGGPRSIDDVLPGGFSEETEKRRLAIKKLNAEIKLTELAAEEAGRALREDFVDVSGGGGIAPQDLPGGGGSGGGSGGGGRGSAAGRSSDAVQQITRDLQSLDGQMQVVGVSAQQMENQFANTFAQIITGSSSAKDALASLAGSLANMFARQAGSGIFSMLFPNANGNAIGGGRIVPFAKGGVVGSPTYFPMRGGTGLMGEAGPEAIMPLTRGADGKLGVRTSGGGGSFTYAPVIDARGADAGAVARIERTLQEERANFNAKVSQFMRESSVSGGNESWL